MDDGDYTEITLGVSFKNMKSLDNLKISLKKLMRILNFNIFPHR